MGNKDYIEHEVVIPGSYNPLHAGHIFMANYLEELFDGTANIYFEITTNNIDKGRISKEELDKRTKSITSLGRKVLHSEYPSFIEKVMFDYINIERFGRVIDRGFWKNFLYKPGNFYFAVGWDTFERILNTKYTADSKDELNRILKQFIDVQVRFLVFPRGGIAHPLLKDHEYYKTDGQFVKNINLSQLFTVLDCETPNISSTEIRNGNAPAVS